jgi:hypothetical protein
MQQWTPHSIPAALIPVTTSCRGYEDRKYVHICALVYVRKGRLTVTPSPPPTITSQPKSRQNKWVRRSQHYAFYFWLAEKIDSPPQNHYVNRPPLCHSQALSALIRPAGPMLRMSVFIKVVKLWSAFLTRMRKYWRNGKYETSPRLVLRHEITGGRQLRHWGTANFRVCETLYTLSFSDR